MPQPCQNFLLHHDHINSPLLKYFFLLHLPDCIDVISLLISRFPNISESVLPNDVFEVKTLFAQG